MIEINIDANICKKDGLCAKVCPLSILKQEEKDSIPKIDDTFLAKCFRCGQCVSICPHGAIKHSHFPEGTVNPVRSELIPTFDQVLELIHYRRTKRLFKEGAIGFLKITFKTMGLVNFVIIIYRVSGIEEKSHVFKNHLMSHFNYLFNFC